jgi:hypothetical protein
MTISTPGNAVDGMIAAVVFPAVEVANGTVELYNSDVDEVNGSVLRRFDIDD